MIGHTNKQTNRDIIGLQRYRDQRNQSLWQISPRIWQILFPNLQFAVQFKLFLYEKLFFGHNGYVFYLAEVLRSSELLYKKDRNAQISVIRIFKIFLGREYIFVLNLINLIHLLIVMDQLLTDRINQGYNARKVFSEVYASFEQQCLWAEM